MGQRRDDEPPQGAKQTRPRRIGLAAAQPPRASPLKGMVVGLILPARCANQMATAQTRKCSAVCGSSGGRLSARQVAVGGGAVGRAGGHRALPPPSTPLTSVVAKW